MSDHSITGYIVSYDLYRTLNLISENFSKVVNNRLDFILFSFFLSIFIFYLLLVFIFTFLNF